MSKTDADVKYIRVVDTVVELSEKQLEMFHGLTDLEREYATLRLVGTPRQDAYLIALATVHPDHAAPGKGSHHAYNMESKAKVKAFMREMREARLAEFVMSRGELAARLSKIARTNISDVLNINTRELMCPETGELYPAMTTWSLKPLDEMTNGGVDAISEMTAKPSGLTIKLHSPMTAQKQLAELMGYNKPIQVEVTGALSLDDLYDQFEDEDSEVDE